MIVLSGVNKMFTEYLTIIMSVMVRMGMVVLS